MNLFGQEQEMVEYFTDRTSKELKYIRAVGDLEDSGENYTSKIAEFSGLSRPSVNKKAETLSDQNHNLINVLNEDKQGHTFHSLTQRGREIYHIISPLFRSQDIESLRKKVNEFQDKTLRMPDRKELQIETGYEIQERDLYRLDYYTEPNQDLKKRAKEKLTGVVPVALAIHYDLTQSNAFIKAEDEVKAVAENYVENNSELLDRFEVEGKKVENKEFSDIEKNEEEEKLENPEFKLFKAPEDLKPFIKEDKFILNAIILPDKEDIVWYPED